MSRDFVLSWRTCATDGESVPVIRRLLFPLLLLTGVACGSNDGVTLFVAASMIDVAESVATVFEAETGTRVVVSAGASSLLARQIANGAPADLFLSADPIWMDDLVSRGLIDPASRVALASNELVLIAAKDEPNPPTLASLAASRGRLAVGDPAHVPVGRYAKAALQSLGLWATVEPRIVAAADARAAVTLVARGEIPIGICYATDVRGVSGVVVTDTIPTADDASIGYVLGRTPGADERARQLWRFFQTPECVDSFAAAGFRPLISSEVR